MRRYAYIAMLLGVVTGCTGTSSGVGDGPRPLDAGHDGAELPPIDAPGDPLPLPPPDLVTLCGAVPVSLDDWERCYKRRWCDVMVGCSRSQYSDVQQCLDRSDDVEGGRLDAERRERARAVARGQASINVAAFAQCLADTSAARCDTVASSVACATRFTGTVANGGACVTDIECASRGASCEASCGDACCLGTCRPKFREHEACDRFASCEPGLVCDRTCRSGDIGSACDDDQGCDANAWCDAGRCSGDFPSGAACTNLLQCGGQTSCVGLSIVDSDPGQCLSIARPGDRCDDFCYGHLYCDDSGTCRELPQLGQRCSAFVPCGSVDLTCRNGVCAVRDDVGASCTTSRSCQPGLFCTSELNDPRPVCAAPRPAGQPCSTASHCDSYLCSGPDRPGICLAPSDSCVIGGDEPI